jgi:RNA polymerase sigma-70 factor (ECF subfamily)
MMRAVSNPSTVKRAIAGDPEAFSELLRDHDDAMRGVAYRMVGDQAAMDDALQAAYPKAFRNIAGFRAESSFSTWLNRIVVNCCYDYLRNVGRRAEVPLNEVEHAGATDSHEERLATNQQLHHALQMLAPDHRAAVLLVDGEGLSYAEAAEVLNVERGTVASRLNRARAKPRRLLEMPEEMNR